MTIRTRSVRALVGLGCLLLFLTATTSGINAAIVGIPDPGLQSAIKAELGIPENLEITEGDMERLIELQSNISGIESLEGLASAPNIELIALSECSIADISVLEGLPHLKTLQLFGNQATTLTLPPGLQSLDSLDLSFSKTEMVAIPTVLPSLRTLKLAHCPIADFSFLRGLPGIEHLDISRNGLTEVSFLEGLSSLKTLNLEVNSLRTLTFPKGLSSLTSIALRYNQLTYLELPEGLEQLTTLDVTGTGGSGHNDLAELILPNDLGNLAEIMLQGNKLSSLRLPLGMNGLRKLDIGDNQLRGVEAPIGFDLENLDLIGYPKRRFSFYTPLTINQGDTGIKISWAQGTLQSKNALGDSWLDLPNVTSPLIVDATDLSKFFRVRPE